MLIKPSVATCNIHAYTQDIWDTSFVVWVDSHLSLCLPNNKKRKKYALSFFSVFACSLLFFFFHSPSHLTQCNPEGEGLSVCVCLRNKPSLSSMWKCVLSGEHMMEVYLHLS